MDCALLPILCSSIAFNFAVRSVIIDRLKDLYYFCSMEDNRNKILLSKPTKAIQCIENAPGNTVIILDFDETLLLRNSTAEYISNLRPRLLGFILVKFLDVIKPWAWLPHPYRGNKVRDWFVVVVPTILLPWTLLLWQQKAKQLAAEYSNIELISAVNSNTEANVIIASLGFKFVIEPILRHLPMKYDLLVSCRFWRAGDRTKGKLLMIQEVLSESQIKSAILVTDSEDDLPLLQVVEQPCFVIWSLAKYISPFQDFWLTSLLKRIKNK